MIVALATNASRRLREIRAAARRRPPRREFNVLPVDLYPCIGPSFLASANRLETIYLVAAG